MSCITLSNALFLKKIQENSNSKKIRIIDAIKTIAPQINDEQSIDIYSKCISIHQSNNQSNGSFLEKSITEELDKNNIPYKTQVTIDKHGIISGFNEKNKKCFHIIDIVVGENISIGKSIINFKVISCKNTCRERWTQDDWSYEHKPILYILITASNDYPTSNRFRECVNRKIITCLPKKKDDRLFKLSYENLIDEL